MKDIEVRYFAMFREQAGKDSEKIRTSATTYAELYSELARIYEFMIPTEMIQVAVNDEYSNLQKETVSGARVVFIPPVAGG